MRPAFSGVKYILPALVAPPAGEKFLLMKPSHGEIRDNARAISSTAGSAESATTYAR